MIILEKTMHLTQLNDVLDYEKEEVHHAKSDPK